MNIELRLRQLEEHADDDEIEGVRIYLPDNNRGEQHPDPDSVVIYERGEQ